MREPVNPAHLLAAIYPWSLAVFVGAVLLDLVYAGLLNDVDGFPARAFVYSEVSDVLLMIGTMAILFALVAVVASWRVAPARNFLIGSLILIGLEVLAPAVLLPALDSQGSSLLGYGPLIRLVPITLASLLAFAGLLNLHRRQAKRV